MAKPKHLVKFITRPDKPESRSEISFWLPEKGQKSFGHLAVQLSSRAGVRRDHLSSDQIKELISFLQSSIEVMEKSKFDNAKVFENAKILEVLERKDYELRCKTDLRQLR